MIIKVGTRGSKLALAQTNYVIDRLKHYEYTDEQIDFAVKTIYEKMK